MVHEDEVPQTPAPLLSPSSQKAADPPKDRVPQDEKNDEEDPVATRRLRFLTLVQSTLTSFLSIAIAVLQGLAYLSY